jgi:hypothetical protein
MAVRILYLVTALVVLALFAGSFWFNARDFFGNMPATAAYGFRTQTSGGGPVIAGALGEARASGLAAGDSIISIDGERLPPGATEYTIGDRLARDPDGRVEIVAVTRAGAQRTHRLTRRPVDSATMEPVTGLPLWAFIAIAFTATQLPLVVWFAASLLLALRRPRDPEAMLFAFAALLVAVPAASFWLHALLGIPRSAVEFFGNGGALMLLAAIAAFPDGRFATRTARLALVVIASLGVALLLETFGVDLPLGPMFLLCNLVVLAAVWLRFRGGGGSETERQQAKWAVFGIAAALAMLLPAQVADVAGLLEEDGLASFLVEYVLINLGLLMIPLGLLVSLLRYRLYDAEAAISLSAGYAVLTLMLAAAFAACAKGVEWFFENNLGGGSGMLPGAVAAGLAVALVTPLHNRVHRWAEGRFQKGLLHLRRDLPDAVGDLRETSGLQPLLEEVLERIDSGLRTAHGAVLIDGDVAAVRGIEAEPVRAWLAGAGLPETAEDLVCDRSDPLFPLRLPLGVRHQGGSGRPLGWILLGPRPDGSFYGRDDREALAEIADPVARAVRVVLTREAREREQERRLRSVERRLDRALAALGAASSAAR